MKNVYHATEGLVPSGSHLLIDGKNNFLVSSKARFAETWSRGGRGVRKPPGAGVIEPLLLTVATQ